MGFSLGGSSTILHHPLLHYGPSFNHSSSVMLVAHRKVAKTTTTKVSVMAHNQDGDDGDNITSNRSSLRRRAFLVAGISTFPLLQQLKALASEDVSKAELADAACNLLVNIGHVRTMSIRTEIGRRKRKKNANVAEAIDENPPMPKSDQQLNESSLMPKSNQQLEPPMKKLEQELDENLLMPKSNEELGKNSIVPKSVDELNEIPLMPKSEEQDLMATEREVSGTTDSNEQVQLQEKSENVFLSLINAVGIVGSGVLGALYATSQKDKAEIESTVDSLKSTLDKKESTITLLKVDFEKRMSNMQEERKKQVKKLNEKEFALSNQLASANVTITALGQELRDEKMSVENLNLQLDQLQKCLLQVNEEKVVLEGKHKEKMDDINFLQDRVTLLSYEIQDKEKHIGTLNVSLSGKELECKNLKYSIEKYKSDHENACSTVEQLTTELVHTKEDLESKKILIADLNGKIESLLAEKDDSEKRLQVLQEVYNSLKWTSEKKMDEDSKLLSKKSEEVQVLEHKLGQAVNEAEENRTFISSLKKERDSFESKLKEEMNKVENMDNRIDTIQKKLGDSEFEVANLTRKLKESETVCVELKSELLRARSEFSEMQKLLNDKVAEARSASVRLSDELASVMDELEGTRQELSTVSTELKTSLDAQDSLKEELLEIYKQAETTSHDLKEERKVIAALEAQMTASGEQVLKDSEVIKTLVKDLDEAKASLDAMNVQVISLSKELETANSKSAGLEEEKELIYKSLMEQKNIAREAQENIEDAQNLIVRLGTERESLTKRAKKLEEEIATAKGEILRLRRQSNSGKASYSDQENANGVETTNSVVTKRSSIRRKRSEPPVEDSQE